MKLCCSEPSELFRAFSDATRLRILSLLLARGELCVCDLCEELGEIQPKISRHLAVLRRAGLVTVRAEGKWKYYGICEPPSALHASLLRCVENGLADVEAPLRRRCAVRA